MAAIAPFMGLKVWNLLTDPYDHSQLASNWAKVDQHDHSSGKGVQIPTGGIADGAISSAKIGEEQITASKLATVLSEAGAFNTASRTYRKFVSSEETYSNSTTSYTIIDQGTVYVPQNGKLYFAYLAGQKATTSSATIQVFIDGNEIKYPAAGGLTSLMGATAEASTNFGPLYTLGGGGVSAALEAKKGTGEYNTTTVGTSAGYTVSLIGLIAGTHTVEIKAKAGASGTIEIKDRQLWMETKGYE
jgi:hypothetical protein